jgi:hypothetical protein
MLGGGWQLGLDVEEGEDGEPTVYIDVMHQQTGGTDASR